MSSDTVRALAAVGRALSDLASALQREAAMPEPLKRVKLSAASKATGVPSSTLSELIRRKQITATRVGVGRGHYLVDVAEVERYLQTRTEPAQRPAFREVSSF